jgi:hypothetical protein
VIATHSGRLPQSTAKARVYAVAAGAA